MNIDKQIEECINKTLSFMNKDNHLLKIAIDELSELAELHKHEYGIAYATWFNGVNLAHNNKFDEALKCFEKSLELSVKGNFEKLEGASYMNIGNMHMMKGDLAIAIESYNKNLEINKKIDNLVGLGVCYSNLATIYGKYLKDIHQALDFCLKSKDCYIKGNSLDRIPAVNMNIANSYMLLDQIDEAIKHAEQILEYGDKENNKYYVAAGHQALTTIYLRTKEHDKAAFHLEECKKYFLLSNIKFNNYNLDFMTAELLYDTNKKKEALDKYLEIISNYDQHMDVYISLNIYEKLVILYEGENDFKNAFSYQKKIIQLKDELFKSDTNTALQKQKVIYQTEKLESQYKLKLLKSEMDTLRAQMNPHFIFNSLNSINKYILKNQTDEASDYLVKFSQLIRTVLDNARSETISLHDELKTLKLYIQIEALRFGEKIQYEFNLGDDMYLHDINLPPLLLQPYVENAIWHGLMQKELAGKLTISTYNTDSYYILEIDDNGIGRKKSSETKSISTKEHKSHGLKVTEDRVNLFNESNNKNIKIEVIDKFEDNVSLGTKIIIKFEH